jgi:hypothetical protein
MTCPHFPVNDLVALLVDGIRVAEHTCVVALGITLDGTKVPLALAEGATENATVVGREAGVAPEPGHLLGGPGAALSLARRPGPRESGPSAAAWSCGWTAP